MSSWGDADSDVEPHRAGLLPEGSHLGAATPESLEGGGVERMLMSTLPTPVSPCFPCGPGVVTLCG